MTFGIQLTIEEFKIISKGLGKINRKELIGVLKSYRKILNEKHKRIN